LKSAVELNHPVKPWRIELCHKQNPSHLQPKEKDMQISILDDYAGIVQHLQCFNKISSHDVAISRRHLRKHPDEILKIENSEILVLLRDRTTIDGNLLDQFPKLRMLTLSGPYDHIDIQECTNRGILVCAGKQRRTWATAELAFGLIILSRRHILTEADHLKSGGWQHTIGQSLRDQTLGIYGFGKIGEQISSFGRAFGMNVIVWSRDGGIARALSKGYEIAPSREALFRLSDVLSLHIRLTPETRGIVKRNDFSLMKKSALFVNVSRAALVEKGALADSLQAGRPGYAASDVYEQEPTSPEDEPLLSMGNVICTPHMGYMEIDRLEQYYSDQFDRVIAFLNGYPIDGINSSL